MKILIYNLMVLVHLIYNNQDHLVLIHGHQQILKFLNLEIKEYIKVV